MNKMPHCITYQRCDGTGQKQACRLLQTGPYGPRAARRSRQIRANLMFRVAGWHGQLSVQHGASAGRDGRGEGRTRPASMACIQPTKEAHAIESNRQRREVSQPAPTASSIGESDGATTRRRSGPGEDQDRILTDQEGRIANTASSCTASLGLESRLSREEKKRASKSGATHKFETLSSGGHAAPVLRHLGIGQIGIAPTMDGDCAPGVREPSEPRVWGI